MVLGFIPGWPEVYRCPLVCVSLQMANVVTSVCYVVLAAVVVVYAQRRGQQGKASSCSLNFLNHPLISICSHFLSCHVGGFELLHLLDLVFSLISHLSLHIRGQLQCVFSLVSVNHLACAVIMDRKPETRL